MDRKEYSKNYRDLNKKEIKDYKRKWYQENKDKVKSKSKQYYESNKEKIKERNRLYFIEKKESDMNYRIKQNVLSKINLGITFRTWGEVLERILGYGVHTLMKDLQDKFEDDMDWNNFGNLFLSRKNWHVHHIIPMKVYNFYNEDDIKKCWSLNNLTPLWNSERNSVLNWEEVETKKLDDLLPDTLLVDDIIGRHHEI